MGQITRLTEMQRKFAHEIVTNEGRKNGTECAISAGYAEDSAGVRAAELQNPKRFPLVVKHIGELREEYQKKYAVTFERHISELARIRIDALKKGAWSAAVNAEVARGKAAGLYIEQKIIRTGKLDDLSEEELEKRMKEIIDQYAPILEGKVDVADIKKKQKQLRLNGKTKSQPLRPLKKIKTSEESTTEHKLQQGKKLSSPQQTSDPDSTS
jgi:phage terminase small subunit